MKRQGEEPFVVEDVHGGQGLRGYDESRRG